jgi:hypothetical protein
MLIRYKIESNMTVSTNVLEGILQYMFEQHGSHSESVQLSF